MGNKYNYSSIKLGGYALCSLCVWAFKCVNYVSLVLPWERCFDEAPNTSPHDPFINKGFFLSERTAWKAESISAFVVCFFLAKPSNRMRPKMLQHETVGVFVYFISSCGRSGHGGRCQVRSWAYFLALFRLKWIKECLFIIFFFFFVMKYLIPPRPRRD